MANNIAIRLQATGGAELKREFEEAGRSGEQAFKVVGTAADAAGAATDRLTKKAQEAAEAARRAQGAASGSSSSPSAPSTAPTPATSREIERLRFQIDEEYRKQRQLGTAEDKIGRGFSGGYFDESERERLRGLAAAKYGGRNDNDPSRRGLSTYDKSFIKYQGFDVASSLGSGASPITTAFQQGPQVLQQLADREGGLGAGLKQLGVSALSLVTPFTVAGTAVAGLGIAFGVAASQAATDREVLEKATRGVGASTGATVSQLDGLAKATAEGGKVSASIAREYVASYASLGTLAIPVIGDLTRLTAEYAKVTGQDGAAAATELGRAVAEGGSALDAVSTKIGGLDDRTRQLIQTQIEQGDRSGAQATAAEYLKSTVDANAAATTGWAAAWNTATAAANGYWEAAKRIAGIKLGIAPEGATEAVARLQILVDAANKQRSGVGLEPLNPKDSENARQLAVAKVIADQERLITEGKAAEARADKASTAAGDVARAVDPNYSRLSQLKGQQTSLRDALSDPLARSRLADFDQTEAAYNATTRAITTMTDATGKMVSAEEMARRSDQLRLDSLNAKTTAEKAAVAERQKAFDLIGKTITGSDAKGQIDRAGILSRAQADSKGSGGDKADKRDDFDSAERNIQNSIRRQNEQNETYGMGAEAVARYRTQTELLTAAKRAEREVTPELTAKIEEYANQASEAAKRNEELRESSKRTDEYRSIGSDGVRTFVRGLSDGVAQGKLLENVMSNLKSRIADLASNSISDMLFGKRGGSDAGFLSSLFSGGSSAANAPIAGAQG
ncbi:hypothetical protein G3T14_23320, partial [Methylobacterium sp. BTF04]|uniref:phage tail length tape measure family protein n=1 Tax=Methylobacterium sp. BTF04 TaxID=2708300 RepID=UPI0013D53C46